MSLEVTRFENVTRTVHRDEGQRNVLEGQRNVLEGQRNVLVHRAAPHLFGISQKSDGY